GTPTADAGPGGARLGRIPPARPPTCNRPGRTRLRRSIVACALLLAFAGLTTAAAAAGASKPSGTSPSPTTGTNTTGATVATTVSRRTPSRLERQGAARWQRHLRPAEADTRHWRTVMPG